MINMANNNTGMTPMEQPPAYQQQQYMQPPDMLPPPYPTVFPAQTLPQQQHI